MLSILTPAFNESANLDVLYERILSVMIEVGGEWEWLIVDDHSSDETFSVVERLAGRDPRVRGLRLARNSGSHIAIACGLHHARGVAAVMMAADLQDPPETLGSMLAHWRHGAQVVWATRRHQPGDRSHAGFAAIYYWIMRRLVGMKDMPSRGADFFLLDRVVIDAFRQFKERNFSVLALVTSLGFRQVVIEYDKQPRAAGRSGWTMRRKIALVVDSVIGFSGAPIRWCLALGAVLVLAGFLIGVFALVPPRSVAAALLAAIVGLAGVQLVALGIVGEYVWRALDEARGRPVYSIEAFAGSSFSSKS